MLLWDGGCCLWWVMGLIYFCLLQEIPRFIHYSALPLDLVGTIINKEAPLNSVCLIRSIYPLKREDIFQPGQEAFDLIEIREILRNGVIVKNLITSDLEYVTFQKDKPRVKQIPTPPPTPRLTSTSSNTVNIDLPEATSSHY
jgi:hypothetical protein